MNLILKYEQGYISFSELESVLWDFGQNATIPINNPLAAETTSIFFLNVNN
ncbi:hypothetical protein A5819_002384 [Enterococcus sp. 7E2_DIV0204]|uniref:hypothetical protein n=1 Tax=unclassified Enterococcus TaxID=2608891 RepID=UPI000B7118AD|nr:MULTISPECIES: hypothetical protein [unclassified Enterococcus]OTN89886.1 hypothetical protein A5819_002384 [Enterococcus sp. 7E2_DIV0204]OTP52342.1 hypothetical protein A5884_001543 [Enterococcus sp. 7D2_DIV0200]